MSMLFAWFISGLIFFLMIGPLSAMDKKRFLERHKDVEYVPDQSALTVVIVVWGFIGALFIRSYDIAFFYMASIFILSALLPMYKSYDKDKPVYDLTPFGLWIILGLLIPFIAP